VTGADQQTLRLLMSSEWRGNVRQLDNAIERAVMLCDDETIAPSDLPPELLGLGLSSLYRKIEELNIES